MKIALKLNAKDNVAVIFAKQLLSGMEVEVRDEHGQGEVVKLRSNVPYGHKIAVRDIRPNEPILKYGEQIGKANCLIPKGEHVHVHNLDCQRGRGDLN